MLDPSGITLGQVSSTARDLSIVGTLIVIAWKARGVYESAANFFKRTSDHMDKMEHFAKAVVDNHLKHIEADLKILSGRRYEYIEATELIDEPKEL